MDHNFHYRQELKKKIIDFIAELNPSKQQFKTIEEECPMCNEPDSFMSIPQFHYGRCIECFHEVGFEYYSEVMHRREEDYKKLSETVTGALNKLQ
ncbi:hypothetical protein [Paenibacillus odorifer]|uniref:Uncharacterized protein n=1 Tax=Paenibacillus odorifer TaxID=189426 RepID=A0A1R0Y5G4_9BACL|nr:hypothetical protein [Paenibacillus odorifer]OMD42564.1 hypothetical protein BSK52_07070 [Paenibacillus odorifer]